MIVAEIESGYECVMGGFGFFLSIAEGRVFVRGSFEKAIVLWRCTVLVLFWLLWLEDMTRGQVLRGFSYEHLEEFTNGFSEDNFIGKFQFGKVYRGMFLEEAVTVKIWEDPSTYKVYPGDTISRFQDELVFLKHQEDLNSHPNKIEMIGCTRDGGKTAVVYNLNSLDTVHNLLCKDHFTWPKRIKVALGFASLLEFLHARNPPHLPYLVRNIDAAHIMLDQDYNPILFDFSMISGGILTDKRDLINQYVHGCYGYIDPNYSLQGKWSEKCDVFAFGVVLLGLITKRVFMEEDRISHSPFVYEWAQTEYNRQKSILGIEWCKCSLVHQSLEAGPFFYSIDGHSVTNLAMRCVEHSPQKRPTMKQAVKDLLNLCIAQHHVDSIGVDQLPHGDDSVRWNVNLSGFWRSRVKKLDVLPKCYIFNGRNSVAGPRTGMEFSMIRVLSYEDLNLYTDGFSEENFIAQFQFGKVYRGKMGSQRVTVKIWEDPVIYPCTLEDNEGRLRDEIILLQHPNLISHPNLVKLIGYCYEDEKLGIVYDLDALDTVHNLLLKDSLTWIQRIKIAFGFACLLKFLHAQNPPHLPYLVRNISAAHIMIDQDYNPILFDFGFISGGILPDRRKNRAPFINGCYGYVDIDSRSRGIWSEDCDVYAFGVVVLRLICKILLTDENLENAYTYDVWAMEEYKPSKSILGIDRSKCSLVHKSLYAEPGFYSSDAPKLTKLAVQCVDDLWMRPTMKQVVKHFLNLRVVRHNADSLGIKQMLRGHNINQQEVNIADA